MRRPQHAPSGPPGDGPTFRAVPLWSAEPPHTKLHPEDRVGLALISTIIRCKKGEIIQHDGGRANAVFSVVSGMGKLFKVLPGNKMHIVSFLFPDDMFGMAERGLYTHSAMAITDVTLYRIPITLFQALMRQNARLNFQMVAKLCEVMREDQRHAYLLNKKSVVAQLAFFIVLLREKQVDRGGSATNIELTMSRLDIAAYIGISPEAVSRALHELVTRGVIAFRDRHHVTVTESDALEQLAEDREATPER